MNLRQLQSVREWVGAYIDGYVQGADGLREMHELKRDHTLRVARTCRELAAELGWAEADVNGAEALGLLHDVGRFSQLAEFRTLADTLSVNHGQRGREVVERQGVLDALDPAGRQRLLDGISAHNRPHIPAELASESVPFAKLIRDADKLDIYTVVEEAVRTGRIYNQPEIVLSISLEKTVSPASLAAVRERRVGSYSHMKTLGDFFLVQMTWIYDINFVPTLRRLRDGKIIQLLAAHLPDEPDVRDAVASILADLGARAGGL